MPSYQRRLLGRAVLVEGGLLGLALLWAGFAKISLQSIMLPVFPYVWIGMGLGSVILVFSAILLSYGARYFSWCRRIKHLMEYEVAPLFRHVSAWDAFLLALISGVSEEVLFRGILQAQIGIVGASILFGLAHVWRKDAVIYGIYAAFIGAIFGGVYALTQNLWAPIMAHMLNNFVAIVYCGKISQRWSHDEPDSEEVGV